MAVVNAVADQPFTVRWADGHVEFDGICMEDEEAMSALSGRDSAVVRFAEGISRCIAEGLITNDDQLSDTIDGVAWYRVQRPEPDHLHGTMTSAERAEWERAFRVRHLARVPPSSLIVLAHSQHVPTLTAVLDVATAHPAATAKAQATIEGTAAADAHIPVIRRHFKRQTPATTPPGPAVAT